MPWVPPLPNKVLKLILLSFSVVDLSSGSIRSLAVTCCVLGLTAGSAPTISPSNDLAEIFSSAPSSSNNSKISGLRVAGGVNKDAASSSTRVCPNFLGFRRLLTTFCLTRLSGRNVVIGTDSTWFRAWGSSGRVSMISMG